MLSSELKLSIVGLGYVGLPLAIEFGKRRRVVGFDIDATRIAELEAGRDRTMETSSEELSEAVYLKFTSDLADLALSNCFIIAVPTPIDADKRPDLSSLLGASEMVGKVLKAGDIVIYESTVYPGCTEEECVPVLERVSGLLFNRDFYCGYSPERINPGDKEHRIANVVKVTSGSTPEIAGVVDSLYREIVVAGTHSAASIKVAEASKVIENTQRDLNIALVNELAIIFNRLAIDTEAVLEAAGTKWNFLRFRPGLVGGHCIGVDPYYLTSKANAVGYHPQIISAGRRLNDGMSRYAAERLIMAMNEKSMPIEDASVLVLGLSFKANCPDIRNSKIVDFIEVLQDWGCRVDVHDPVVNAGEVLIEFGIELVSIMETGRYDAIVIAVAHDIFRKMSGAQFREFGKELHLIYDVQYMLDAEESDLRL